MTSLSRKPKILLVEDDPELGPMIVSFLRSEGFEIEWVRDGLAACDRILTTPLPDLVVLDVMLPNLNGIEICQKVRPSYDKPILMLTAKNDDLTEINSINHGADGYLTKPVRPHVLLAHIKSKLCIKASSEPRSFDARTDTISVDGLQLFPNSITARINGELLPLSTAEYELLEFLVMGWIVP